MPCRYSPGTVTPKIFLLNKSFTFRIKRRSGFVKNKYVWIFENRSCNSKSLPFTTTQFAPAVADICLVAVFFLHDKTVSIGDLRCLDHFLICSILFSKL